MMKRRNSSSPSVSSAPSGPINQISNNSGMRRFSSSPDQKQQQYCSPPPLTSTASSSSSSQGTSCPPSPLQQLQHQPLPPSCCTTTTTMSSVNGCEASAVRMTSSYHHPQQQASQSQDRLTSPARMTGMPAPAAATSLSSSSVPPHSSSLSSQQSVSKSIHSQNSLMSQQQQHQLNQRQTLDPHARSDVSLCNQQQTSSLHPVSSPPGVSLSSSCASSLSSAGHAICYACNKIISERFLLKAMDEYWHEDCLKCSCCDCRLGEVGSTLFTKANLILCKRDYLRLFGSTGTCAACHKVIPAFEMVMRARGNTVFHLECFKCQAPDCSYRFCVGDEFHMLDNRILCKFDYDEIMSSSKNLYATAGAAAGNGSSGAAPNGSSSTTTGAHPVNNSSGNPWCSNSLENLRRQTESLKTEIMNN